MSVRKIYRGAISAQLVLVCVLGFACVANAGAAPPAGPGWRLLAATGPTNLPPVTEEMQQLAVDATGGTFTLTFENPAHDVSSTTPVNFDVSAADLEASLNALPAISGMGGQVRVTGGPGNAGAELPYSITFGGSLAGVDVSQLSTDGSGLSGGAHAAIVTTPTPGTFTGHGFLKIYPINVGGAASTEPVTVEIPSLPEGITTSGTSPNGWSCVVGAGVTCTRAATVKAQLIEVPIILPLTIDGAVVPEHPEPIEIEISNGSVGPESLPEQPSRVGFDVSLRPAPPGLQAFVAGAFDRAGRPERQAGGHPYSAITAFLVNTRIPRGRTEIVPSGNLREASVNLPPGFLGDLLLTDRCPQDALAEGQFGVPSPFCGSSAVVGGALPLGRAFNEAEEIEKSGQPSKPSKVFNDMPPVGYPAELSASFFGSAVQNLFGSVRSEDDFGLTVTAPTIISLEKVYGSIVVIQGFPAGVVNGFPVGGGDKPILDNPTNCGEAEPTARFEASSWAEPSVFDEIADPQPPVTGCDQLHFEPNFDLQPSAADAATPTSASAHLHVDQAGLTDPGQFASPHLKKSVVTLPTGLDLNPAAADGLEACSTQQIGLITTEGAMPNPIRFDKNPVACPEASKIGTAEISTPVLEDPLNGTVYLAAQDDNPFRSLLAMYLVIDDAKTGTVVKLPGKVSPDPQTGQLTATFDNNPQLPFEDLTLNFRGGGPRSTLATPDVCGKYTVVGEFTPWSAPESGPPAQTQSSFEVSNGVGGSAACPATKASRPFDLGFSAGTANATAGAHSPFTLDITRPDGNQELDRVSVVTPPGFAASFKGVSTCSDAAIAAAGAPGRTGNEELANPSCPASSQIGTTAVGVGVGSSPLYVKTGKAYLTGPYKGAPLSFTFIVPAVAGPFDLGVQVVKTAVYIDPKTAQVTAVSDPIPQILKGIPLLVRDIRVSIDRDHFTLNPTNCEPMAVLAQVTGASGAVANLANRFQARNCGALAFHPGLKLQLHGGTKRGKYQRLEAIVTYPEGPGYANIARAAVTLPHSEFLAQEHIRTVCTRVQFAAKACPSGSIYGYAEAVTPLLDEPLTGPVYLRSSDNPLPDLVAALRGPDSRPIEVELSGRTDSSHGGIRNTFDVVPDVPVSRFTLQLLGGKKSLIVNSRNLCEGRKQRATVLMNAQNGLVRRFRPQVGNDCGKRRKDRKRHGHHGRLNR